MESRLAYSRELLSTKQIDPEDFRSIKIECGQKLERLESKLAGFSENRENVDELLSKGMDSLFRLDKIYTEKGIEVQREVIGSMYPENLTFDGFLVRTARINEAASLIYNVGAGFSEKKTGQISKKTDLSCWVTLSGFKPETFSSVVRCSIQLSYRAINGQQK